MTTDSPSARDKSMPDDPLREAKTKPIKGLDREAVRPDGPPEIWLEPSCCADPHEGRMWSDDCPFVPCCEGGPEPTRYVRADVAEATFRAANARGDGLERVRDGLCADVRDLEERLTASEARERGLREIAARLVAMGRSISTDLKSAHDGRANAASQWMREDDREQRQEFAALLKDALALSTYDAGLGGLGEEGQTTSGDTRSVQPETPSQAGEGR